MPPEKEACRRERPQVAESPSTTPMSREPHGTRPSVGLALGSGSARGLAHIGVIRALGDAGIHADCVAGTSIGAVVGAVHASGKLEALEDAYLAFDWKKVAYFMDMVLPRSGLIDGRKVTEFVREYVHSERIEDLPLPFRAVATDLESGDPVILQRGDLIDAVRASFSLPGLFTPVRLDGRILVDGGLVDPVPVGVARDMGAGVVIAVDLNHGILAGKAAAQSPQEPPPEPRRRIPGRVAERYRAAMERIERRLKSREGVAALARLKAWTDSEPLPGIFDVMLGSIHIMETQLTRMRLQIDPPDLLIRPSLGDVRLLDFHRAQEIIEAGYEAASRALEQAPAGWWPRG